MSKTYTKKDFASRKGVQGEWVKIKPDQAGGMLPTHQLVQKATVVSAGKQSVCKEGDRVIVRDWLVEKIEDGDGFIYYTTNEGILEIL